MARNNSNRSHPSVPQSTLQQTLHPFRFFQDDRGREQENRSTVAAYLHPLVQYLTPDDRHVDAMNFLSQKFQDPQIRVLVVGEQHASDAGNHEDVSIRDFFKDLILRLYEERQSNGFRVLVMEDDERFIAQLVGHTYEEFLSRIQYCRQNFASNLESSIGAE